MVTPSAAASRAVVKAMERYAAHEGKVAEVVPQLIGGALRIDI
jgi:hypothetical protein